MLETMHFHHIGYAVRDIEKTATFYTSSGWTMSAVQEDKIQKTFIAFLRKEGEPMIELVSASENSSPVSKTITNGGGGYSIPYLLRRRGY